MWLFGVMEADFLGAVDVDNCESILFMPRLPASYAVWMGESVVLFSRTLFSVYKFVDSNIKKSITINCKLRIYNSTVNIVL